MKQKIDYAIWYSLAWTRTLLQIVGMISCVAFVRINYFKNQLSVELPDAPIYESPIAHRKHK